MSATMIPKLEARERSRSPSLFQHLEVHQPPSEMKPSKRRRAASETEDVSQSGMPAEDATTNDDDVSNHTPDLLKHSSEQNQFPLSSSSDVTNVSSSCGNDSSLEKNSDTDEKVNRVGSPSTSRLDADDGLDDEELHISICPDVSSLAVASPEKSESNDDNVPDVADTAHCDPGGSSQQLPSLINSIKENVPVSPEGSGSSDSPVKTEPTGCNDSHVKTELTDCDDSSLMTEPTGCSDSPVKSESSFCDYVKAEPTCSDNCETSVPEGSGLVSFKSEKSCGGCESLETAEGQVDLEGLENGIATSITSTSQNGVENDSEEDSSMYSDVDADESVASGRDVDGDISFNDVEELQTEHVEDSSEVISVADATNDDINVSSTTQEIEPMDTTTIEEHEVVDVESYEPCVVDLTCEEEEEEEENDVDVVEVVEQPIIFLGSERRRRHRRRRYLHPPPLPPPPPLPHQVEDVDSGIAEEPGEIVSDDSNNNAVGPEDIGDNLWGLLNPPEIDLQNPNLTFGSLLEPGHVETVEEDTQNPASNTPPPDPPIARRELRRSRRHRRSRSRSPNLFPDLTFNDILPVIEHMERNMGGPHQEGVEWVPPVDAPIGLPLDANPVIAAQQFRAAPCVAPQKPPASPPPVAQPTITCLVCLDSITTINSSSRTLCSTTCGHVFCSACIEEVVKQRKQCPVCRKRLTKRQYHPLFL